MKQFTDSEIMEIRTNISNGVVYCGIDCYGRGMGRIYKSGIYIAYEHYGQSAIEDNNKKLKWLLQTIFEDCETVCPAVWSDFHINYIPEDSTYKGIDLSSSHPNVMGL